MTCLTYVSFHLNSKTREQLHWCQNIETLYNHHVTMEMQNMIYHKYLRFQRFLFHDFVGFILPFKKHRKFEDRLVLQILICIYQQRIIDVFLVNLTTSFFSFNIKFNQVQAINLNGIPRAYREKLCFDLETRRFVL